MSLTVAEPMPATGPVAEPRRLARGIGVLYLLLAVLGMVGPLTVQSLLVPGDASATAANVAGSSGRFGLALGAWVTIVVVDVLISVAFYVLLRHVGQGLSMLTAAFRIVYSVVVAALLVFLFEAGRLLLTGSPSVAEMERAQIALETFSAGFLVALVFFGVHLVLLSRLLFRSSYVPRALSVLVALAGAGYVFDSLAKLTWESYGGALGVIVMVPAIVGEIGLGLWLTIRGVRSAAA